MTLDEFADAHCGWELTLIAEHRDHLAKTLASIHALDVEIERLQSRRNKLKWECDDSDRSIASIQADIRELHEAYEAGEEI